jgi:carboxymethylenebutenolidase
MTEKMKAFGMVVVAGALWALLAQPAQANSTTVKTGANGKMKAVLMTPDGPGPYPAILVLHTSGGLESADTEFAQRLVKEGYVVLLPYYFAAYGIEARTRQLAFTTYAQDIYADLVASLNLLRSTAKVDGSKLGAVGFSSGGYFALWLAATGQVQAGVSWYGAVTGAATDKSLSLFRRVFTAGSAPVLIFHGDKDSTVPIEKAIQLDSILTAAGSPHEFREYSGTEHLFDREGGSANKEAAADAWLRTQAFFNNILKK